MSENYHHLLGKIS